MRDITKLLCFIFSIGFYSGVAQNEGTIWYLGGGEALDFTHTPPSALPSGGFSTTEASGDGFATLTQNGKVVAISSGKSIGNLNGMVAVNGNYLYGTSERQLFIPKPGSNTQYYFFYIGQSAWNRKDVMYCIIDIDANGTIRVLEKNIVLYAGLHGYFTLSAGCGGKNYWLVGEADRNTTEGTDKIFAFRIDESGISNQVISTPVNMTQSGGYRFSPDGTKLFFHFSGGTTEGTAVADFDRFTGVVSNLNIIGPCCGFGEFSSSVKMLYVNYSDENEMDIIQYDLTQSVISGNPIAHLPYHGTRFQIAIDGRIYIILMDGSGYNSLGIINSPNLNGINADVQITHPFYQIRDIVLVLPEFSTNTFYQSPYAAADAGEDKVVCAGDTVLIGGQNLVNQHYQWIPDQYLCNPKSPQTNFTFNQPITQSNTLHYILKGLGDECVKSDTMTILVRPKPMPVISGSPSVCPGVNSVLYSTEYNPNYTYNWSLEGGTIIGNTNQDSIHVDWGNTNPNAMVHLQVNNEFNCPAEPEKFPVRINTKLETQKPIGLAKVCENLVEDNIYYIDNTNGSIYTWEITGGTIDHGQGTNTLKVDWTNSGLHELWVLEKSITKDTVCFGISDTLLVKVYTDTLQALVNQVSVHANDDSKVKVWGELKNVPPDFTTPITLLRKDQNSTDWRVVKEFIVPENRQMFFEDHDLQTDNLVYDYQFKTINGCQLETSSLVHHTIRTTGVAVEEDGKIMLEWNPYDGWPNGNLQYEIWRKMDADTAYAYVKSTNLQALDLMDAALGFRHAIKLKAISPGDTLYSWSNQIEVVFEHALFIPNIFTPSGDHLNETFTFEHIELYPDNELVIYNRNSQEVYRQRNYTGNWNGGDLSSGIYYYYLRVFNADKNESYKGWVQIMR